MASAWPLLAIPILLLLAAIAFLLTTRIRAHRQGLPAPPLSSYNPFSSHTSTPSGGVVNWARQKFTFLSAGGGSSRGYGPASSGRHRGLDPDGAWDTRVGDEADAYGHGGYYEEQELGLHPPSGGGYSGGGYGASHAHEGEGVLPGYGEEVEMERGRSRSRDEGFIGGGQRGLDVRYDEEMVTGGKEKNPFGDEAERSRLRGMSPRQVELDGRGGGGGKTGGKTDDSPTERKSMFHENM